MSHEEENFPKIAEETGVPTANRDFEAVKPMSSQDIEAFIEQAVEDYESALIGYARTYLHDLERARDVVQDTFIRLCQQDLEKVRENLKAWLFTVCRNRCLDVIRKDKRIEPLDEIRWQRVAGTETAPDEQAENDEKIATVMRFMDRLPKNQKEVILLKFQQGMNYTEIHDVTGLTQGNIGFLIHTGLKRLREWLPDSTNI